MIDGYVDQTLLHPYSVTTQTKGVGGHVHVHHTFATQRDQLNLKNNKYYTVSE